MLKKQFTDAKAKEEIEELLGTLEHHQAVLWAADCAEHILPIYEEKNPKDDRPLKAIRAARAWIRGEIGVRDARQAAFATHAAAREIEDDAAIAAARAAGQAVSTVHLIGHAIHASTYAAKAAAYASGLDDQVVEDERKWQLDRLNHIRHAEFSG